MPPGRPRTLTDDAILAGVGHAISRVGPARLTLADVATEVRLAPATLVQRFGSKRELLLAYSERGAENVSEILTAARAAHASPLDALLAGLAEMTADVATPTALAHQFAILQLYVDDPEFHGHAIAQGRAIRAEIRTLLDAAVAAGELSPTNTDHLARSIQATYNGSLVTWAVFREGTVADWLSDDLARLLGPYRQARC